MKKLGRFINFKYFEHQQFVLFYLSNHELSPIFLHNYLHFVILVRMLSWVDIFIETFVIALSIVCSCSEVPGDPPRWATPGNGGIRRETTFLMKTCGRAKGGELSWPCLQCILSIPPWDLTVGHLWEADFCFQAGKVKSESGKCQTEIYVLYIVWKIHTKSSAI